MVAQRQISRLRLALVWIACIALLGGGTLAVLDYTGSAEQGRAQMGTEPGNDGDQIGDPAAASQAELAGAMARLRERARTIAAQRERKPDTVVDDRLGYPSDTIVLAHEIFAEMWAVRGLVHTHEQRVDAARRLLAAPRALELVYHTVTDPSFARDAFGEQQAEARYYGILVMEQAAKDSAEHQELLKHAVGVVHRGLTSDAGFDPGQGEDFRGLLTAYTGTIPSAQLNAQMMRTLGYASELSPQMKQIYFETMFSVLWKRDGIEAAEARFKEMFPEG